MDILHRLIRDLVSIRQEEHHARPREEIRSVDDDERSTTWLPVRRGFTLPSLLRETVSALVERSYNYITFGRELMRTRCEARIADKD